MERRWLKISKGKAIGVTTIIALFTLLSSLYGFTIVDLTGDIICEGTYENPCISEFEVRNPNAYVVDIYSADQVKLDFSPNIKDYALFVPDGRCSATGKCACDMLDGSRLGFEDWRCVDFTEKTKPRQDKVYNFRFPRYSTTHFLLAGIKNNPNDEIKWTFGTNEAELDPIWRGLGNRFDAEIIDELRRRDTYREPIGSLLNKKYKSYNATNKEILIEDYLHRDILRFNLESDYEVVTFGWNDMDLIAWFNLSDFDGESFVDNVRFYDVNNNYIELIKNYTFKYKNSSNEWVEFDLLSELPNKNIEIGLFTDIISGDKIEWVIEKDGFEFLEWAIVVGTNAGLVATAPTADPEGAFGNTIDDAARALKITTTDAVKITEIGWYTRTATEESNFEVAIYSHDSGFDIPDASVGTKSQTNAKGTDAGWKTATTDIDLNGSTIYWIAVQLDNTATTTTLDHSSLSGQRVARDLSESTLPDPWTGGQFGVTNNQVMAAYALFEAAPSDSCTYVSGNFDVTCLDNCTITSDINLGGNNLTLTAGPGNFDVRANITNYDKIIDHGPNLCEIRIYSDGFK